MHSVATDGLSAPGLADQPMDPELWRLVLAAVYGASRAADNYLEVEGWRPRVRVASVGRFESGWPHVVVPGSFASDDGPIRYSGLFGAYRNDFPPICYSDIDEFEALFTYVERNRDLCLRLWPFKGESEDISSGAIRNQIAALPLSIMDRARAIGQTTEQDYMCLYLERERAWLLDDLPVEYVIPITLTAFDLNEVLVIDTATRLEPLDEPSHVVRAIERSGVGSVSDVVVGAATHAIVVSGQKLVNYGPGRRMIRTADESPSLVDADLVCEALRILADIDTGYSQVLRRPIGWTDEWIHDLPVLEEVRLYRRYPEIFDDYGWLRVGKPIGKELLDRLPTYVVAMRAAAPNVRLAARRLSQAKLRDSDEDQIVDACIGLEALLGEGRDELTHRLGLRAATALATRSDSPLDSQKIYDLVKRVYAHRSAVVHGTTTTKYRTVNLGAQRVSAARVAVMLLRQLLNDLLSESEQWTAKTLDLRLLAGLAPPRRADRVVNDGRPGNRDGDQ